MDSSYGNGGQNIPGAKPGVIASGPDAPDIPGVTLESENPNGVLSKLSRKSGGNKMPVIDGGGGPKQSKKGLLFVGMALIGIALIIGIVALVLMGKGNNNSNGNSATGEYAQFYNYANYILDGQDVASADLGSYNKLANYAATDAFNKNDTEYFNKANELWQAFYNPLTENGAISEVSALRGSADYQNQLMDFVVKYVNTKDYTDEELLKLYISNGFETANTLVDKNYEALIGTIYDPGKEYATAKLRSDKTLLSMYSVYDSLGCVKNGEISKDCANSHTNDLKTLSEQYEKEQDEVNNKVVNSAIRDLTENCFTINDEMRAQNGQE